jgi:hypothetical protein
MGVKSIIVGDDNYCPYHWPATKVYVIVALFRLGLIQKDLYWYHDFDCFQLNPFADIDRDMAGADMGLTNYGRMPGLCSASMFFRDTANDIFERYKAWIDERKINEEKGIANLINANVDLQPRIRKLNTTYAFQKWNMHHSYHRSDKPIKAVHFHLTPDKYDFFINGNNRTKLFVIPDGMTEVFHKHGFKY